MVRAGQASAPSAPPSSARRENDRSGRLAMRKWSPLIVSRLEHARQLRYGNHPGWIGTGIMGRSMCGHLLAGGHGVQIYSRTRSKAEDLIARGARWVDSPAAAARGADVVFTMVGLPSDVREVYFGESGIFGGLGPGTVLVDMTTTEPRLAVEIADRAPRTRAATGGGRAGVGRRCRRPQRDVVDHDWGRPGQRRARASVLRADGEEPGPPGRPRGRAAHQDVQSDRDRRDDDMASSRACSMRRGPASIWRRCCGRSGAERRAAGRWRTWRPRVIARNFDPGFLVEHFIKDMGIALDEARRMNACAARPGAGAPAARGRGGAGTRPQGHARA